MGKSVLGLLLTVAMIFLMVGCGEQPSTAPPARDEAVTSPEGSAPVQVEGSEPKTMEETMEGSDMKSMEGSEHKMMDESMEGSEMKPMEGAEHEAMEGSEHK